MAMTNALYKDHAGEPHNYHDYTRNLETATAFMEKYSLDSTLRYRERFAMVREAIWVEDGD